MLFVKLLCLFAGGGVLTGVSVSNAYKGKPQTPVANNKTEKKRARLELKLTNDILKSKQTLKKASKVSADTNLKTKKTELETAKTDLKTANTTLNKEKTTLNTTAENLKKQYKELETKNDAMKVALEAKIADELSTNEKALQKTFYEAQQSAYETEKTAIEAKIAALKTPTSVGTAVDSCSTDKGANFTLSLTETNETTTKIESEIKAELLIICTGLEKVKTQVAAHAPSADTTKSSDYDTAKNTRDEVVKKINELNQEYNLQIHKITSAESDVQRKIIYVQNKESFYKRSKQRSEKLNNDLDILNEKIDQNSNSWSSF